MKKEDYYIPNKIGLPAMYEQLAEECAELAQASLKMARILRGENPTPKTRFDVGCNIEEEFNDILLVSSLLKIRADTSMMDRKLARWEQRLLEQEEKRK